MLKPNWKIITAFLISISGIVRAQEPQQLYNTYLKNLYRSSSEDTLRITVKTASDLEEIVNSGIKDKVYDVTIQRIDNANLTKIFEILSGFPKLDFLFIDGKEYPESKSPLYKLPDNIELLSQLKGIKFSEVYNIDMDDAIKKIATLKQLQLLSFFACNYPLPSQVAQLKNIKVVQLGPRNIADIDVSQTNWQIADVLGFEASKDDYEKALSALSHIASLQKLYLSTYYLGNGDIITKFRQINALYLYEAWVHPSSDLLKKIGQLKQLRTLSLSSSIETLSLDGIQNLQNLTSLYIQSYLELDKYPERLDVIRQLKNLESLSLVKLNLITIPDVFTGLPKLKKVSLSDNAISKLPESLFKLSELEYLDVSSNRLVNLPKENYNCKNLKTLILSFNGLTELPSAITDLKHLEKLDVWGNQIKQIPRHLSNLESLKEINLSINQLTKFPDELQEMHNLEKIDLSHNDISYMPDILGNSYQLKFLGLNDNELTSLPKHIGKYTGLEYLNASGNRLNALPTSLGDCKKLKFLGVSSIIESLIYKPGWEIFRTVVKDSSKKNTFKFLPTGLKDAKDLEALFVSGNPSIDNKSVFDVILAVPRKNFSVILSHDNIRKLPASPQWSDMNFSRLDLSYNKLTTLPAEFVAMKIYNVDLKHNMLPLTGANYDKPIKDKADMKILFNAIGVKLPENY